MQYLIAENIWPRSVVTPIHQSNPANYDFISDLPQDMWRTIFSIAKTNLQEIALVSKKWKEMAYDKELYRMIVPSFRFGEEAWKKLAYEIVIGRIGLMNWGDHRSWPNIFSY